MKILIHSSKAMKPIPIQQIGLTVPQFIDQACELQTELSRLNVSEIISIMKVSRPLADAVHHLISGWKPYGDVSPAALTFRGDIYSGLQAHEWDEASRVYATEHLWILSGLYGILRPFDGIRPYRLEMGYPLRVGKESLYEYWNRALAALIVADDVYINVTANEYLRAIKKSLGDVRVVTPKFLTVSPKTGEPIFVTVHAKVARGAFANWLITEQIDNVNRIHEFNGLGYVYNETLSAQDNPVFVCSVFGGIGLSTWLT
jgi:cytoplasmic iron level regulating protein YaaA (DUF328/UPF0246 family)